MKLLGERPYVREARQKRTKIGEGAITQWDVIGGSAHIATACGKWVGFGEVCFAAPIRVNIVTCPIAGVCQ